MFLSRRFAGLLALPLLMSTPAFAYEEGDILVRGRLINVMPNESTGPINVAGTPTAGSSASAGDGMTLDIDFTYMFKPHWGVELLLDLSSEHALDAEGTLGSLGHIVDARVLPPSLLLQYHFKPESNIRPYVGAGLNYTMFFDEQATSSLSGALGGTTSVRLEDSWGLALQAGVDIDINDKWFFNADIKYIDIDTKVKATAPSGLTTVDAELDPTVVGLGIGYRF